MTKNEFESLLQNGEYQNLGWKKDWPPGFIGRKGNPTWGKWRGELLTYLQNDNKHKIQHHDKLLVLIFLSSSLF